MAVFKSIYCQLPWLSAANTSLCLWGTYVLCLWASMSIYRLFFYRLCEISGPVLAIVSKFWHVAHCLDSKDHLLSEKLHQKYGDFVRTGPNELTIFTPKVMPVMLEGINNQFSKPSRYDSLNPYYGLTTHRNKSVHDQPRPIPSRTKLYASMRSK
ncbi:hypothetical protein ABVK25_001388 [Lepraria finkii]|uniref:Uncharacterized protein n=1 Tax=Lepraria finkii TaxID=1340010 RepID=A0ABR4BR11_9LECA